MPGLGYSSGEDSDMDMGEGMGERMGEAGDMDIVDAVWWAEQQRLRFFQSPMKEDADRDYSWACSNCTFQNAAGIWQCEMCSHHKPGESCYCVLVLSKHAAACFVGDSHSLLFFVVDALAGAMVLRMTDSGPAAVPATSTAPLLPMVAGDAGGAGKRSRAELQRQSSREGLPSPQHKKGRTRRTARQKGSSTGLEVGCNFQQCFQHWRSPPADCCGKLCRTKSHRRQNAADVEVIRRALDRRVHCGCALSAQLHTAGRWEYKGGCVAAGGCTSAS